MGALGHLALARSDLAVVVLVGAVVGALGHLVFARADLAVVVLVGALAQRFAWLGLALLPGLLGSFLVLRPVGVREHFARPVQFARADDAVAVDVDDGEEAAGAGVVAAVGARLRAGLVLRARDGLLGGGEGREGE